MHQKASSLVQGSSSLHYLSVMYHCTHWYVFVLSKLLLTAAYAVHFAKFPQEKSRTHGIARWTSLAAIILLMSAVLFVLYARFANNNHCSTPKTLGLILLLLAALVGCVVTYLYDVFGVFGGPTDEEKANAAKQYEDQQIRDQAQAKVDAEAKKIADAEAEEHAQYCHHKLIDQPPLENVDDLESRRDYCLSQPSSGVYNIACNARKGYQLKEAEFLKPRKGHWNLSQDDTDVLAKTFDRCDCDGNDRITPNEAPCEMYSEETRHAGGENSLDPRNTHAYAANRNDIEKIYERRDAETFTLSEMEM